MICGMEQALNKPGGMTSIPSDWFFIVHIPKAKHRRTGGRILEQKEKGASTALFGHRTAAGIRARKIILLYIC